jgi:ATP-dependent helicase/nuclease subunit B
MTVLAAGRRLFTIPASTPFLPCLVEALGNGTLIEGLTFDTLPEAILYLPTRRAARALSALLAERSPRSAILLPRILTLGEAEDVPGQEIFAQDLSGPQQDPAEETTLALPFPAIPALERRLVLARLTQAFAEASAMPFLAASPADALALAADLEKLMDQMSLQGLDWDDLGKAVEGEYSEYFALTLTFIDIAARHWPKILEERRASDPVLRQCQVLDLQTKRLQEHGSSRPVIIAGSTGSLPVTARFMAAVASLDNGAVVLPGLDLTLDAESWAALAEEDDTMDSHHGHPQKMMARFLAHFLAHHAPTAREAVIRLGTETPRDRFWSKVMLPATTTDLWGQEDEEDRSLLVQKGLAHLRLIEAQDERGEALAAAIALREILEQEGKKAALVTPDRGLAARVAAELSRWNISVEDSAGLPLSDSPPGTLARLAAELAAKQAAPIALLALLNHPLVSLDMARDIYEQAVMALEIGVLRGPAPARGWQGLHKALEARRIQISRRDPLPRRRLTEQDWERAKTLLQTLEAAFDGFFPSSEEPATRTDMRALMAAHRKTCARLRGERVITEEEDEEDDPADRALEDLFQDCALAVSGPVMGTWQDYPAFFTALSRERILPPSSRETHQRIKILGPLEARLLTVDRIVLGCLDEGIWPPECRSDAFLSRPMRTAIGLPPPERRIGQSAHDFVQSFNAPEVIVTRAIRRGGKPMVPSRFLQRLKAFCGEKTWTKLLEGGAPFLAYAEALDEAAPLTDAVRPSPKATGRMVREISVSEVETLLRDPYAFYARRLLALEPLERLEARPDAAERGSLFHDSLALFVKTFPQELPENAEIALQKIGETIFAPLLEQEPDIHALWWPRFLHMLPALIAWERERRTHDIIVHTEISGRLALPLGRGRILTLRARADRIEEDSQGHCTILDFKTGTPPALKHTLSGLAPQMTLQAALLAKGGFGRVGSKVLSGPSDIRLNIVHLTTGKEPVKDIAIVSKDMPISDLAEHHLSALADLWCDYDEGKLGFLSRAFPKNHTRTGTYDHLARVKEWSLSEEEEGEEMG